MSGYFARLAQRSGDAAPAPAVAPATAAFDVAPADQAFGFDLERSEVIEAAPAAAPAAIAPTMPAAPAMSAIAHAPAAEAASRAPAFPDVAQVVEQATAPPRPPIVASDRDKTPAAATRSRAAPGRTMPAHTPRAAATTAPDAPASATPRAFAAPPPHATSAHASADVREAPMRAPIEVHHSLDAAPRSRAESVAPLALPNAHSPVREARADATPRTRAGIAPPSPPRPHTHAPSPSSASPPSSTPMRAGVEVNIGRIELEIVAAPASPPAAVAPAPSRAPRPASAFNPHRHYLRGG